MKISKTFTPLEKKHDKANVSLAGFTLIELILVVAIVAVLAGAMIPVIISARQKARVSKVLQFYEAVKTACQLYNSDTGQFAAEESPGGPSCFTGDCGQLSSDPPRGMDPGWDGPYCRPFEMKDNPFGFTFPGPRPLIVPRVNLASGALDFDLDGDGAQDRAGAGNQLIFYPASASASLRINDALDANIPGDWRLTGRVKYSNVNQGFVIIYIAGGI